MLFKKLFANACLFLAREDATHGNHETQPIVLILAVAVIDPPGKQKQASAQAGNGTRKRRRAKGQSAKQHAKEGERGKRGG